MSQRRARTRWALRLALTSGLALGLAACGSGPGGGDGGTPTAGQSTVGTPTPDTTPATANPDQSTPAASATPSPDAADLPRSRPTMTNLEEGMTYLPDELRQLVQDCAITPEQTYQIPLYLAWSGPWPASCDAAIQAIDSYRDNPGPAMDFLYSNPGGETTLPAIGQPRYVLLITQPTDQDQGPALLFDLEQMTVLDDPTGRTWYSTQNVNRPEPAPLDASQVTALSELLEAHLPGWDYWYSGAEPANGGPAAYSEWSLTVVLQDYSLWRFESAEPQVRAPGDLDEVVDGLYAIAGTAYPTPAATAG